MPQHADNYALHKAVPFLSSVKHIIPICLICYYYIKAVMICQEENKNFFINKYTYNHTAINDQSETTASMLHDNSLLQVE